ncbi:MAG: 3-phosphoshikimate 1-carboxyvinyltransferase, partial [Lachnospiraceae bacterium]|nr:3-phosphoshikimate 1-carboxyvinyltransferase [Lachnospiraceae bacterium]
MTDRYLVHPLKADEFIRVDVPGSKSITNRALLLAAMGTGKCTLNGVLISGDSRAFLSCLKE